MLGGVHALHCGFKFIIPRIAISCASAEHRAQFADGSVERRQVLGALLWYVVNALALEHGLKGSVHEL